MKTIAEIEQRARFRGRRVFALHDDGTLKCSCRYFGQTQEHTVEVGRLEQTPRRDSRRAISLLVGLAVFALVIIGLAWGAVVSTPDTGGRPALIVVIGLFCIPAFLCWREYLRQSYDLIVFLAPYGGDNVVLFNDLPSPDVCGKFVTTMKEEIQKHRGSYVGTPDVTEQIRQLAKLKDEGILTEAEFSRAKERIIESGSPEGTIGFHQ